MDVDVLKKIVKNLTEGPKPIAQIASDVGIGWKTCEKYLEGLKALGYVEEKRTKKERLFQCIKETKIARITTIPVSAPRDLKILKKTISVLERLWICYEVRFECNN